MRNTHTPSSEDIGLTKLNGSVCQIMESVVGEAAGLVIWILYNDCLLLFDLAAFGVLKQRIWTYLWISQIVEHLFIHNIGHTLPGMLLNLLLISFFTFLASQNIEGVWLQSNYNVGFQLENQYLGGCDGLQRLMPVCGEERCNEYVRISALFLLVTDCEEARAVLGN